MKNQQVNGTLLVEPPRRSHQRLDHPESRNIQVLPGQSEIPHSETELIYRDPFTCC